MSLDWVLKDFPALSATELYAILRLRQEVFVVEQRCAFLDADGRDANALHLAGWHEGELLAYARLHVPGAVRTEALISRVVTAPKVRRDGYGRALMTRVMTELAAAVPGATIWLGAQARLEDFYAGFGFVPTGEPYLEDEIWHIGMLGTALRPA